MPGSASRPRASAPRPAGGGRLPRRAGGLLIEVAGAQEGWRWVFLVNLFIGAVALPVAYFLIPRRHRAEEHGMDPAGNAMLALVLLLVLFPLVEGRVSGWPLWSWLLLGLAVPAGLLLFAWEVRLNRRGGEPVIQVGLLWTHRSFGMGQGLGRSALQTGLLVLPFALGSLLTASNSYRFSRRFGRKAIQGGISGMLAGQALILLAVRLSGSDVNGWALAGPLLLAGLGNGLVIAPNQDFVLASVPREQADTAGGALITAQRLGAAIGIAVIGTALFGSGGSGGSGSGGGSGGHGEPATMIPGLVHNAQGAGCHGSIYSRMATVDGSAGGAMDYNHVIDSTGEVIDGAGVAVLVVGAAIAVGGAAVRIARHEAGTYLWFRQQLGRTILLGLELLVAADIVRTVATEPTFSSVAVLGIIVLIRTFLSFSLEVELNGRWPWQKKIGPPL